MTRSEFLNLRAGFVWNFGCQYYVTVQGVGNFVWSSKSYEGGTGRFQKTNMTYKEWITHFGKNPQAYGRDKGSRRIGGYCGNDIRILGIKFTD